MQKKDIETTFNILLYNPLMAWVVELFTNYFLLLYQKKSNEEMAQENKIFAKKIAKQLLPALELQCGTMTKTFCFFYFFEQMQ